MKAYIMPNGKYVIEPERSESIATSDHVMIAEPTTFDKAPDIYEVVNTRHTASWVRADGHRMSPDRRAAEVEELLAKRNGAKEDGVATWTNLDDEFAYRKFLRDWTAEVITQTSFHLMEIVWVTHREPTSSLVNTSFYNGTDPGESLAWVSPRHAILEIIHGKLRALGFVEKDTPGSDPQPAKTYKLYDLGDVSLYLPGGKLRIGPPAASKNTKRGTLEECEEFVATLRKSIELSIEARAHQGRHFDAGVVLDGLACIRREVWDLDVKHKAATDRRVAIRKLDALIEAVERAATEKQGTGA